MQFVLVGRDGKPRGAMTTTEENEPAVALFDEAGTQRVSLGVADDGGAGLSLFDARGEMCVSLGTDATGDPGLVLWDSAGKVRATLQMADNSPRLSLYDTEENERGVLTLHPDGTAQLALIKADGSKKTLTGS